MTEFFSSVSFGITAMVITGFSWCLIGFIMGAAPKRGIDPSLVQLFGYVFSVAAGFLVMFATGSVPHGSILVIALTFLVYMICGVIIFCQLNVLSYAMQRGPNGIIWAVNQSAMIFPFIGGILFFGVALTIPRLIGIITLLSALVFFGIGKDNSNNKGGWKIPAFICLILSAVQQNLQTAPSYFEEARIVNSIVRTQAASFGGLLAAVIYNLSRLTPERKKLIRENIGNKMLWKYVFLWQFFGLLFSYALMYPGMDAMADHGMGGMCYPMMVGAAIISFTLTSILFLKEKIRGIQLLAMLLCIAGLIFICIP